MDSISYDKASFIGGTAFGVLPHLPIEDIVITIIMAFVGAAVSFIVSVILKYAFRKKKK